MHSNISFQQLIQKRNKESKLKEAKSEIKLTVTLSSWCNSICISIAIMRMKNTTTNEWPHHVKRSIAYFETNELVVEGKRKQRKVIRHWSCFLMSDVLGFRLLIMTTIGLNRYRSLRRPFDRLCHFTFMPWVWNYFNICSHRRLFEPFRKELVQNYKQTVENTSFVNGSIIWHDSNSIHDYHGINWNHWHHLIDNYQYAIAMHFFRYCSLENHQLKVKKTNQLVG